NPFTNARPSYHHESIGGYHGAKLRLFQDYIDRIFPDPGGRLPNENALDLLNVRYIVAGGSLPGTGVVYRDQSAGMYVLQNGDALPGAFFGGEPGVIGSAAVTWARLESPEFDPRETALLAESIDFQTTPLVSAASTPVHVLDYSPRRIVWNVFT